MTTQAPDTPGEVTRLAAELRRLREQAGLSFTELAEQTPYSRSAWQRYLTAKVLPPWTAVRDLCRLAGEPEPRLRALWELAESAFRGRGVVMAEPSERAAERKPEPGTGPAPKPEQGTKTEPGTGSEPGPEPGSSAKPGPGLGPAATRGRLRLVNRVTVLIAVLTATVVAAAGVYLLHGTGTPSSRLAMGGRFTVSCTGGSCDPSCQGTACNGQDPQLTMCGAQGLPLIQRETPGGDGLEIRYNPQCRAAWARFWNTHVGDTLTLTTPGQPAEAVRITDPRDVYAFTYTPLVSVAGSGTALKACIKSGTGAPDCFTATAS